MRQPLVLDTFTRLDSLLAGHRQWWQFQPFHHVTSRWEALAPDLHHTLAGLNSTQLDQLAANPCARARQLRRWIPEADELLALCRLPQPEGRRIIHNDLLARHTGGRKWAQVTAFAAQVPANEPVVEWCSGKGHLGRLLAANGAARVDSLEWHSRLCRQGVDLAARSGVQQHFHTVDVMSADVSSLLLPQARAVALHACGKLHLRLLELVVEGRMQAVSLAPCCYYLIDDEHYRPLSRAASASALRLAKPDLHTPLRETVTGGNRARRLRARELRWRLAFDCLQRELRDRNEYLPVPPAPGAVMHEGFERFARWACERKGLPLPAAIECGKYLALAEQRLRAVREMELLQQVFQRPLEMWLALDRALYLEEHGYRVALQEFCPRQLTPRNILIDASRQ